MGIGIMVHILMLLCIAIPYSPGFAYTILYSSGLSHTVLQYRTTLVLYSIPEPRKLVCHGLVYIAVGSKAIQAAVFGLACPAFLPCQPLAASQPSAGAQPGGGAAHWASVVSRHSRISIAQEKRQTPQQQDFWTAPLQTNQENISRGVVLVEEW